jgi:hypothetical protein
MKASQVPARIRVLATLSSTVMRLDGRTWRAMKERN